MLKLLIVDDEPMFREGLIKTVNWQDLGIHVIGEAYNGIEALSILKSRSVDLIITDIRMPEMSGLELIRQASVDYPHVRFIVLSAFDDFQQVKLAFNMGIVDYIIKSDIRDSELKEILLRQSEELKQRESLPAWSITEYAEKNRKMIILQILKNCVNRKLSLKEAPALQEYFHASMKNPIYAVALSLHHTNYSLSSEHIGTDLGKGLMLIETYIQNKTEWIGYSESRYLYLFYIAETAIDWLEFSNKTENLRLELCNILQRHNPSLVLTAGFSSVKKSTIPSRQKSEAEKACHHSLFRGIGRSIGYNQYQKSLNKSKPEDEILFRDFITLLKKRDMGKLKDSVNRFILTPVLCNGAYGETIINLYQKYYYHLLSFCEQMGLDQKSDIREIFNQYLSMRVSHASLEHLNLWLKETIIQINKNLLGRNSINRQVTEYLNQNYMRDISLTDVAEIFHVNPSYLSRTFSKNEGKGFITYLTELRIQKALELMENKIYKIYEVGEQVGIRNPESFSRSFKKITRITPKEYFN